MDNYLEKTGKSVNKVTQINKFWIAFLYIALFCAIFTITGKATGWPSITIFEQYTLDIMGMLTSILFGTTIILLVFDFPKMISFMQNISLSSETEPTSKPFDVPTISDEGHGKIII